MKPLLFIVGALFISSLSFSMSDDTIRVIHLKGKYGIAAPSSVEVTIGADNTLTTTFNKDMDNVTITVKKQSDEVISVENMDAFYPLYKYLQKGQL